MKPYFKAAKWEFAISNILAILCVILEAYYPLLLAWIVDHFTDIQMAELFFIFASFVLSIVLILLTRYFNKIAKAAYQKKICTGIRRDIFRSIAQSRYTQFHSQKNEQYVSFLVHDVERLYSEFFENIIYLSNSLLMLVVCTAILGFVNWQMCLVIIGSLLLLVVVPRFVGQKYHALNSSLSSSKADYLARCEEILEAHELITAANKGRLLGVYETQLETMQQSAYLLTKYQSFVEVFSGSALYIQLILCFVAGLTLSYFDVISLGVFASSLLYVEYVAQYSANIVDECLEIRSSKTYREKFSGYLHMQENVGQNAATDFQNITLNHVSYCTGDKTILKDISYNFRKGRKYLITGANGSGKSTLLKIIAGLLEPSDGKILWNKNPGYPCGAVGYIPQRRYVFEGSLQDNISLFKPNLSQEDLNQMAAMCKLIKLNYPLAHPILRHGENLSGGEIAKICFIRELYRGNEPILLDEPFNDIDAEAQQDILEYLQSLDRTILMVAHGLGNVAGFDEVLTVRDAQLESASG